MKGAANAPQGPTPAEERMLSAYDTFDRLLRSKPAEARRMSYEIAEIAERYQPQPQRQVITKEQNR